MKKLSVILLILTCFFSCIKKRTNEVVFPAETQSGKNTFGCYIDGDAFIPSTTVFGTVRPINVYYTTQLNFLYRAGFLSIQGIDARSTIDIAGSMFMQKLNVFNVGEYSLHHVRNCTG